MITILSFCVACGVLLPEGMGRKEDPECTNCGANVEKREDRIEGEFSDAEAGRLIWINFGI